MTNIPSFIPVDFDPFEEGKEIEKITLTSDSQREIWLSCIIGGKEANLAYNESVSLDFDGQLDYIALKKAVAEIILRHEALRSTISPNGEILIIYKNFPAPFELEDISNLAASEQKKYIQNFLNRELAFTLDLQKGPLFRVFLHRLNAEKYYFTLIKHHVICDGWSTGIILEDLSKIYNALINGTDISLGRAFQISEYVIAEDRYKLSEEYKATETYWLNQYKEHVPVLDLPTDRPRVIPRSYQANRIDFPLTGGLVHQIKSSGAKVGSSLVTTLLAAFEVLLYKITKQRDIIVGLPTSGQSASGLYNVVGHCVNLLPLKTYIDPSLSLIDYLKQRKRQVLDAYDHQRLTFGELIKKLVIPRDTSRVTLIPVIFNIDKGMDQSVSFNNLKQHLFSNPRAYENFEIYLNATGSKDDILLEWSYNTGLFDQKTIQDFHSEYEYILKKFIENPNITISALTSTPEINAEEIKTSHGLTLAVPQTLNDLIHRTVRLYPNKIAVRFNNSSISYQDLFEKSNQIAIYLIDNGIKTGDFIGLCTDRSIEMLLFLLGILKAGAVYIPLDPSYPKERIEFMVRDSTMKVLIINRGNQQKYDVTASQLIIEDILLRVDRLEKTSPDVTLSGSDLAYILYTSGSTGKPKGVKITHGNLANFLISMQNEPGITANDCLLAVTTISFDIAGLELYLPLISGAELVIADQGAIRDGRLLLKILEKRKVTIMQATPSTWQMMIDCGWKNGSISKVLCGGEALSKELAQNLLTRCDELWNMYGPTETTIWSTIKHINHKDKVLTIGLPINNTQIYIVDGQNNELPPGMPGEILIGGDGVATGYLNRSQLTEEKFIQNKFSNLNQSKVYKTGDVGLRLANGEIQYLGRIDHQVKIRGYRIELGEIEAILAALDGIKQAVVVAREDRFKDKHLVAYIVLDKFPEETDGLKSIQKQLSKDQIDYWTANLKKYLPDYMIPFEYMALLSFPITPNGKIDRNALPEPPSRPEDNISRDIVNFNETERLILSIWQTVLGMNYINLNDDFFELGGHSLLAVKVMTEIEKETGKRLPLASFFENSTVAKLAKKLTSNEEENEWNALVPIKTSGSKDPIYLIHGGGLNVLFYKPIVNYLDNDQPIYGFQALGLYKRHHDVKSVEEISAIYIKDLLKANPEGPYCLAGYSLGGIIAFEMAKQLTEINKNVKFIAIVDTYVGSRVKSNYVYIKILKKIRRQFSKFPFVVKTLYKYPREAFTYQLFKFKIHKILPFLNLKKPESLEAYLDDFTDYEKEIYDRYDFALKNYVMKPADVKINLLRVTKRIYYLDDSVYLGWQNFAKKGVIVHLVPGDHKSILYPPNDQNFARVLQSALDNV